MTSRLWACAPLCVAGMLALMPHSLLIAAAPQQGSEDRAARRDAPTGPAGDIQRLLDAYAIMQAQEYLGLTDQQFPAFVSRLRSLQETRRRIELSRLGLLRELERMSRGAEVADRDRDLGDRLKALREYEVRSVVDLHKAYETVDQVLDLRQRARFRVFEEEMERRKLELLMRARLGRGRIQRPLAGP